MERSASRLAASLIADRHRAAAEQRRADDILANAVRHQFRLDRFLGSPRRILGQSGNRRERCGVVTS